MRESQQYSVQENEGSFFTHCHSLQLHLVINVYVSSSRTRRFSGSFFVFSNVYPWFKSYIVTLRLPSVLSWPTGIFPDQDPRVWATVPNTAVPLTPGPVSSPSPTAKRSPKAQRCTSHGDVHSSNRKKERSCSQRPETLKQDRPGLNFFVHLPDPFSPHQH